MTQADAILAAFEAWLTGGVGVRRVVLEQSPGGFLVTLTEERSSIGPSLVDASAQIATVVNLDGA
jgi:hypothetical protein